MLQTPEELVEQAKILITRSYEILLDRLPSTAHVGDELATLHDMWVDAIRGARAVAARRVADRRQK